MGRLCTVAVTLKIPDNAAHTALAALRRLGVIADRLERADIWQFDPGESSDIAQRFEANESLFNPNKHQLSVLESAVPREGEVWVAELDATDVPLRLEGATSARRLTGWRLFKTGKEPVDRSTVQEAAEKLLCNPAIERALYS